MFLERIFDMIIEIWGLKDINRLIYEYLFFIFLLFKSEFF